MKNRAAWLEERKTYIGASELAAICGINSYDTPRHVWMVKKGLAEVEESLPMQVGNALENLVAWTFAKEVGIRPQALRRSGLVRHPDFEFMGCNPDRMWLSHKGGKAVVQLKTCNQYASGDFGRTGTDEVKDEYLIQTLDEMWITGAEIGYLAVLIGNGDFRWYRFTWTDTTKAIMKKAAEEAANWWFNYYIADELPPLLHHERDTEIVKAAYPTHEEGMRLVTSEIEPLLSDWPDLQARYDELDKELRRRKNVLREFIGDTAGLKNASGETLATWKADKNQRRSLRLKFEGEAA